MTMSPSIFHRSGIREIDFFLSKKDIKYFNLAWKDFLENLEPYPVSKFQGKGIVMCAGGTRYFTCAWVAINHLRNIGCKLPIEVWFLENELTKEIEDQLLSLSVSCKKFNDFVFTELRGYCLKPLAIIHSQFNDVLFLDADNNCVKDPSFLFNSEEYLHNGAIFWPDYWTTAVDNPIWEIVDSLGHLSIEQESGQILINKQTCWQEMNLCLYFNENHTVYHRLLWGDKDTFKFAWLALKSKYHMIIKAAAICGYENGIGIFTGTTIVQHSTDGSILFLHRNLLKWDISDTNKNTWKKIKEFKACSINREYFLTAHSLDIKGDVQIYLVTPNIEALETYCFGILKELRDADFYIRFLADQRIS